MTTHNYVVRAAKKPLRGSVPVASDKSIGHRALMLSALTEGVCEIKRFTYGEDNVSTMAAMRNMGVPIEDDSKGYLRVNGVGLFGLKPPTQSLDCGNSGTTMRLLAGILAAQNFRSVLIGDESLSKRPMARIVNPLRRRGAVIEGQFHPTKAGEVTAPLVIGPVPHGAALAGAEETLAVASAQVKSALLLSGLYADGNTYVQEPVLSRDHTERMLKALGVPLKTVATAVELDISGWEQKLPAFSMEVPGDLSAAAFLLVAAQIISGSEVTVRGCGVNPSRAGILEIIRDCGAGLEVQFRSDELGEPTGDLLCQAPQNGYSALRVGGEVATRAIDEIPIVCALAARARGVTQITDVAELRVKESDRIATMVSVLRAFGVQAEERPDGMLIEGRPEGLLTPAQVDSYGDHRVAMTAAILGLISDGETVVKNVDCVATSFPRFAGTLRALGAEIEVVEG